VAEMPLFGSGAQPHRPKDETSPSLCTTCHSRQFGLSLVCQLRNMRNSALRWQETRKPDAQPMATSGDEPQSAGCADDSLLVRHPGQPCQGTGPKDASSKRCGSTSNRTGPE